MNLFLLKGLNQRYALAKADFAHRSKQFIKLLLPAVEQQCRTFAHVIKGILNMEILAAAATRATPSPSPTPVIAPANASPAGPAYPSKQPPKGRAVTNITATTDKECLICFQKHGLTICGYALRA